MKWKNLKAIALLTTLIVIGSFAKIRASETVEWAIHKTLRLDAAPIDVAITPDGRRIYVLTDEGEIHIYSSTSKLEAKIDVGKDVDQIKVSPWRDIFILSSRQKKTVQLITVDFIQNINVSGSPFKGPENAPVVIAVFNDFQ